MKMIEGETTDGTREREGVEDDGNIGPGLNPFLQPPILKELFEVLSVEDLAKCRLVSKLWLDESLSTWRSKATLKFEREGIVTTGDDGSRRTTSLGEFLDLWEAGEWGSCPFKKFNLKGREFKAGNGNGEEERFLELVGGHVTSLTLEECSFVGVDHFRRIIYQAFPKLQFLKIDRFEVDYRLSLWLPEDEILAYKEPAFGVHALKSLDISDFPPSSILMEMLSHFHKLKSLCIDDARGQMMGYRDLLETIRVIRAQDRTKLPLKNFDVHFSVWVHVGQNEETTFCIQLLKFHEQLNLPLQRFQIFDLDEENQTLDSVLMNKDVFRDILQHHSSTLKSLNVSCCDSRRLYKSFPFGVCLEKLEELNISPRSFDNLNDLRSTPNLRVLSLLDTVVNINTLSMAEADNLFSNSSQLEIGDWTFPYLTELTLFDFPLSVSSLGKLMKWMPNVECLSWVQLDDVKFSMICSNWKKLKSLDDNGNALTDEGVLGIENANEADGDEGTQSVPNITKLKNLTSFRTFSSRLTSASVHEGFLKLADLKELSMKNFEESHLSDNELDDEAKAALERRKIGRVQPRYRMRR